MPILDEAAFETLYVQTSSTRQPFDRLASEPN